MVISHTHKYLFVELPRTGSTAISRELCQHYHGERIMRKHSTYFDFLRVASEEEKEYFVFSCIRNPLDDVVSRYVKIATDHRNRFTDPETLKKRTNLAERVENRLYNYVHGNDADFEDFFLKFYILPYNNWASISRHHYDFVIRFESLPEDFEKVLRLLDIEPVRQLPPRNVTSAREDSFVSYYSPRTIPRARRVFGPFMKLWDYQFPEGWGEVEVPWWNELEFRLVTLVRSIYWRYLRLRVL